PDRLLGASVLDTPGRHKMRARRALSFFALVFSSSLCGCPGAPLAAIEEACAPPAEVAPKVEAETMLPCDWFGTWKECAWCHNWDRACVGLSKAWAVSEEEVYAIGRAIVHTTDGGQTWQVQEFSKIDARHPAL